MDIANQKDFSAIKADYRFTKDDATWLQKMRPELESSADEFLEGFYEFI